jgi:aromatic ring-opening dioxygenase LigB subunit
MSLVFTGIAPHPPLLIPNVGKDIISSKLEKTKSALDHLEEDLYLTKPDIILIISPHSHLLNDAFSLNVSSEFTNDFKEFGDLGTKLHFEGDIGLAAHIREKSKLNGQIPLVLLSEEILDHGAMIPLMYLTRHLPQARILPVGFCALDLKTHIEFGYFLKEEIMKSTKRVAVVASGDLSHALTTEAPGGYNARGKEFDEKIQELFATRNTAGIMNFDLELAREAAECGLRSFAILMGILRDIAYEYKSYAYEAPFGVGYLTANFVI